MRETSNENEPRSTKSPKNKYASDPISPKLTNERIISNKFPCISPTT